MALTSTFLHSCSVLLDTKHQDEDMSTQLAKVIEVLDLSPSNLAVALIFLDKYRNNSVNSLDNNETDTLHYYVVIASLILSNKYINDQSYTIKTWHSILAKFSSLHASLPMLNQFEQNFLASLGYSLSTKHHSALWDSLSHINTLEVAQLRSAVHSPASASTPLLQNPVVSSFGLATPPLMSLMSPESHCTHASYSSPLAAGPITPVSLPIGTGHLSYAPIYAAPLFHQTPMTKHRLDASQPKRRKLTDGHFGMAHAGLSHATFMTM